MATSALTGFLVFLPLAIIFLAAAVALVFVSVLLYKKGNKTLAIVLIMIAMVPLIIFLIYFVMIVIYVLEINGIM